MTPEQERLIREGSERRMRHATQPCPLGPDCYRYHADCALRLVLAELDRVRERLQCPASIMSGAMWRRCELPRHHESDCE